MSAKGATALDMVSIPNISTAKPSSAAPMVFRRSRLPNIYRQAPKTPRTGVKVLGFSSWIYQASPSSPVKLRIQAVMVVPMLAPIMSPMACRSCMIPELTKPTTITVVAEELWITAVTPAPTNIPRKGLEVNLAKMPLSRLPAVFSNDSPIKLIPKRNKARPPNIVIKSKTVMAIPFPIWIDGLDHSVTKSQVLLYVFGKDRYFRYFNLILTQSSQKVEPFFVKSL